ncbi:glycoside hydrolase family 66 protein [Inconstantimicrobium porci]|uniref:glycoside hydrolase family 66 protein n=1 Tax=Inconstantimicrobium porci TaxID=2652291 RepID=UPI0024098178|nr:glycoside hydrolase family 66 protein [Inconstantimicrobium porci]MDD6770880.1 glycoside hydrolase family 66 protein [Inconstantimicrobium porci]
MNDVVQCYPLKAQYRKNEKIFIKIEAAEDEKGCSGKLVCRVFDLNECIKYVEQSVNLYKDNTIAIELDCSQSLSAKGYGVEISIYADNDKVYKGYTAFDVCDNPELTPRYGFISDFFENDSGDESDIKQMNKFHLNLVQFYDWMYRHHELMPPTDKFKDPLGRELSINVVKEKIQYAKKYGMKALGYAAVYGAEREFYEEHKDWALYKNDGHVIDFANFIFLMDINRKCPWHDHLISQLKEADKFGFDGFHLDQYGFPKEAIGCREVRKLRDDFPALVDDIKNDLTTENSSPFLIFNAVNNWPIETVASSDQDVMYIEVWPPNESYRDISDLIKNARRYNPDKQVVLAAYMKPFLKEGGVDPVKAENATILTMATIFANGGFHLLLGEKNGILTEGYYPNYRVSPSEQFTRKLMDYYDFMVKYEELLFDLSIVEDTMTNTGGINGEYVFKGYKFSPKAEKDTINTLVKHTESCKIINLINYLGIDDDKWNEPKSSLPSEARDIEVTAMVVEEVESVYVASPDYNNSLAQEIPFKFVEHGEGKAIQFTIPRLDVWDLVFIKLKK